MTYGELLRGSLAWDAGRTPPPGDLPGRVLEGLRPPPGKPPAPPDQPAERPEGRALFRSAALRPFEGAAQT